MKTVNVVAAIIKQGGKILATQRGYGEFAGGWEFPGGKIEPGETPEQAAVREIREELGATIAIDAPFAVAHLSALTQALIDAGLTKEQIAKVMGGNMMRYLREVLG